MLCSYNFCCQCWGLASLHQDAGSNNSEKHPGNQESSRDPQSEREHRQQHAVSPGRGNSSLGHPGGESGDVRYYELINYWSLCLERMLGCRNNWGEPWQQKLKQEELPEQRYHLEISFENGHLNKYMTIKKVTFYWPFSTNAYFKSPLYWNMQSAWKFLCSGDCCWWWDESIRSSGWSIRSHWEFSSCNTTQISSGLHWSSDAEK